MSQRQDHIAQLYRQYGPLVYRRCLRLLDHPDDAADATSAVFLKLLKHQHRLADLDDAVPWIFEVTTNHCFTLKRDSKRRRAQLDAAQAAPEPTTKDATDELADRQLADHLLRASDETSAKVAVDVLVKDAGHGEVAQQLGVSTKTVQRSLKRFVDQAKKYLTGGGHS